jgi:drug/metabolite transporter (DMT)-like permease
VNSALLGSVAALAWGGHDFLARFPSRSLGPVNTVLGVTVAGLVVLSAWLLFSGAEIKVVWPALWLPVLTGAFIALATLALFAALALGPISIVCPIAGSYPAFAVLIAMVGGARPSLADWLAIVAVMAGVALVSQSGERMERSGEIAPRQLKVILALAFAASLGFALGATSGQAAAPIFGDAQAVWLARVSGLVIITLLYLLPSVRWQTPGKWLPLLGLMGALDVTALTTVIAAGNLPDPTIATVASSGFGAVTVLLAWMILRERIAPIQLIGIAAIFCGVLALASR